MSMANGAILEMLETTGQRRLEARKKKAWITVAAALATAASGWGGKEAMALIKARLAHIEHHLEKTDVALDKIMEKQQGMSIDLAVIRDRLERAPAPIEASYRSNHRRQAAE